MPRARLAAACLIVVGALLLAVACGGSASSDEDGDDDARPRPPARLAAAVTALAEANTGHFASGTVGADGAAYSRIEGDYQLSPPAARATVSRYDAEGERRATEVLAIGRDAWSRDAGAPCWIHHDVVELFANGLLVRNGDTYAPAPVAVAGLGVGVYATDSDQVSGTSELGTVLSVADLSRPSLLGLTPTVNHRVAVTFSIDDDVLVGWKVFVRDAVESARELPASGAAGAGRVSALGALGGVISTELTDQGEHIDATPPPADQMVEYVGDAAELSRRLAACPSQTP